jgi:secreted trypsin-like serine protease
VIVQSQKGELCSGAVIARNLVLTAAHCVTPKTKYRVISFDQNFVPTAVGVVAAARNPAFRLRGRPDRQTGLDIAVLELSERLCHVWTAPADQGLFSALHWSWVRSCLRPFCAEN